MIVHKSDASLLLFPGAGGGSFALRLMIVTGIEKNRFRAGVE